MRMRASWTKWPARIANAGAPSTERMEDLERRRLAHVGHAGRVRHAPHEHPRAGEPAARAREHFARAHHDVLRSRGDAAHRGLDQRIGPTVRPLLPEEV